MLQLWNNTDHACKSMLAAGRTQDFYVADTDMLSALWFPTLCMRTRYGKLYCNQYNISSDSEWAL